MHRLSLDGSWTLSAVAGPLPDALEGVDLPAVVPGCVHTDLLRAGLIPDPFDGDNESALAWIGRTDWAYERTFDAGDLGRDDRWDLVADGLDTFATIWLNGHLVGHTQNQFRSYRFDVVPYLRASDNHLRIAFSAPVVRAESLARVHGELPHVNHHPYNIVRKSAANFGWDWGIDVATSGIWKSIGLESWSGVRVTDVRPLVQLDGETGVLDVHVGVEWDGIPATAELDVDLRGPDGEVCARATAVAGEGVASARLLVDDVQRWWPRGYGDQPLYTVSVGLRGSEQRWDGRVGFRTVELQTPPDRAGTAFRLVVNGERIFVKGANWIPDHAFVTEMDADRYRRRIVDATDAHMNLLRVWGGGIYESDEFYDICDEEGVLVWQDFLFACAAYREDDEFALEVEAEAREAVTRLSPHPSLVVWNGNNENIVAFAEWPAWRPLLRGRAWGNLYYRELLPRIVAELDGTRPYSPGSPYSYDDYLSPNDAAHGTMHIWDVWNVLDYRDYTLHRPRFVSEFGFQGPPAWSTLTRVVHDTPLDPFGPQMLVHQKADQGNLKLERGMAGHLATPTNIDDWHWATQLNQAMAIRFGIEYFRTLGDHLTGSIVWQLNDNWPVVSWAAVDFDEHRKPVWHALKHVYQPRLLVARGAADAVTVSLSNDDPDGWAGVVTVTRASFAGEERSSVDMSAEVGARSHAEVTVPGDVLRDWDVAREVLVIDAPGFGRTVHHGAEVVDQILDADPLEVEVHPAAGGWTVVVTARSLARDVTLLVDRADPSLSVDAGLRTLLAGESAEFTVRGDAGDAASLSSPLVVRHANSFAAANTPRA
ncbi:MAG: beta-galactosidase/beta-glucuronidase [Microbacterium sp.]|jgi:beta-mannosidase|nr:beta-galactosidase/beta-glucuronidase [Microbacterium sp.]